MSTTELYNIPPTTHPSHSWFLAGLTSSFPNLDPSSAPIPNQTTKLSDPRPHTPDDQNASQDPIHIPACKIFQTSNTPPLNLTSDEALGSVGLKEQVLVFQYRGKFHAIDHQCPHRSYPLSRGTLHDIEDFGIMLSAGITCPKHGWAFDLHTGESDRGAYKLGVWEVEVRKRQPDVGVSDEDVSGQSIQEVWVRKKENGR